MALLRTLLTESGLELQDVPQRRGVLAEDAQRVVWAVVFETPQALLEGWEIEQAWFVDVASRGSLSVEKSWDMYLVLASIQPAGFHVLPALDKIRRDVSLTRKLVVPGIGSSNPARIRSLLAPLRPLPSDIGTDLLDVLTIVDREATVEERDDVRQVLSAFRSNEPLLGEAAE